MNSHSLCLAHSLRLCLLFEISFTDSQVNTVGEVVGFGVVGEFVGVGVLAIHLRLLEIYSHSSSLSWHSRLLSRTLRIALIASHSKTVGDVLGEGKVGDNVGTEVFSIHFRRLFINSQSSGALSQARRLCLTFLIALKSSQLNSVGDVVGLGNVGDRVGLEVRSTQLLLLDIYSQTSLFS